MSLSLIFPENFICFLGDFKTQKFPSGIIWPLEHPPDRVLYHFRISLSDPYWHIFYVLSSVFYCDMLFWRRYKKSIQQRNKELLKTCTHISFFKWQNSKCTFFIGNNSCKFLMGYMFNGYWFVFFVGLEYLARKNILYTYVLIWPFTFSI